MNKKFLFTSESVTEGHPDKVADAISDGILDAIMAQDNGCRVACETLVTTGMAMIAGEKGADYVAFGAFFVAGVDLLDPKAHLDPDAVAPIPERIAEPVKTERIEEQAPLVVSVDAAVVDSKANLAVESTYSAILGRLTLKRRETLSRIIRQVYGGFNSSYLKSFIIANPDIENPDRVTVGQIISLPAIPAEVAIGERNVWWLKVDEKDTLEAAFKILRNLPDGSPPVRLIPYWTPAAGSRFAVVLDSLFKNEKSARIRQEELSKALASGSEILSGWDKDTVFFADPYFGRVP